MFPRTMRGNLTRWLLVSGFLSCVACSSSTSKVNSADDANNGATSGDESGANAGGEGADGSQVKSKDGGWNDVEQSDVDPEAKGARKKTPSATNTSNSVKDNPEPEFKEGGSVDEAIKAVPQGLPRENLEQEAMDKPLLDVDIYAPCKLTPSSHFQIRFAVWNGRCVGTDIKTTPNNAKLESCLREVVSKVKWQDRTKSLNISTVSF